MPDALVESPHPYPPPQAREGDQRSGPTNPPLLAGEGGARRAAMGGWGLTALPPGEHRAALFHEGGAAFGVIGAGEAFVDEALAQRHVALARILQRLAHGLLGGADRQG